MPKGIFTRKRIIYLLACGLLWLLWQLLTDELSETIRDHIPEGGMVMLIITHPYIIMPIILIVSCLIFLYLSTKKKELKQEGITNLSLEDTLTEMHRRLIEIQKEKASNTKIKLDQLDRASWTFLDKLGLVSFKEKNKFKLEMKRRIKQGLPSPPHRRVFKFKEWSKYKQDVKEKGLAIGLEMHRELFSSKTWTFEEGLKVGGWLDDYDWGVKKIRDNDLRWNSMWRSITNYLEDKILRDLIDTHVTWSYIYNNICLTAHYTEKLGNHNSFLAELNSALIGSPISPVKAEIELARILEKISSRLEIIERNKK